MKFISSNVNQTTIILVIVGLIVGLGVGWVLKPAETAPVDGEPETITVEVAPLDDYLKRTCYKCPLTSISSKKISQFLACEAKPKIFDYIHLL